MVVQKTLDDFFKVHNDKEALNFVSFIVRTEYLPILAELQRIKREIFSDIKKANLMYSKESNTIKVSLPGYDVYLENLIYSNTPISDAAKMKVNDKESLNRFRKAIAQANENIFKGLPRFDKEIPTHLYFGVLIKAAKVGDQNAINALRELQENGLIQIEQWENIDTRDIDTNKLINEAKHTSVVQEKIDLYAGGRYALEYIGELLKSYIMLWRELNKKKDEIFSTLREFNLIEPGKSIKVTTDYGTVYIGAYENIRYEKINEEEIKDTLLKYGFRKEEFTVLDLTTIMRNERYAWFRKKLEEEKYISPTPEKRIYIRNIFKEAKRNE